MSLTAARSGVECAELNPLQTAPNKRACTASDNISAPAVMARAPIGLKGSIFGRKRALQMAMQTKLSLTILDGTAEDNKGERCNLLKIQYGPGLTHLRPRRILGDILKIVESQLIRVEPVASRLLR